MSVLALLKGLRLRGGTSRRHEAPSHGAEANESTAIEGDRRIASVNRQKPLQQRLTNWMAMALMGALGLGLLTWYYTRLMAAPATAQRTAQAKTQAQAQGEMALPALGPVVQPEPERKPLADALLGEAPELPNDPVSTKSPPSGSAASFQPTRAGGVSAEAVGSEVLKRRLSGPAFTDVASAQSSSTSMSAATGGGSSNENAGSRVGGPLSTLLQPTLTNAVRAQVLPTARLLLPKGTFIDCTLETAIDSSLPGLTTCITATDTFSADGTVVLMERGTKLVGETRGEVQQGTARLFILWTEARTPTGVVVPLASPGTDELGRSGVSGQVNRHFIERFGAAILISVIDGVVQAAVQSQRNGNDGTVVINSTSTTDILTEVLKSTINIPPTLTKQNGDRIQILVARDLDFRSVYELKANP